MYTYRPWQNRWTNLLSFSGGENPSCKQKHQVNLTFSPHAAGGSKLYVITRGHPCTRNAVSALLTHDFLRDKFASQIRHLHQYRPTYIFPITQNKKYQPVLACDLANKPLCSPRPQTDVSLDSHHLAYSHKDTFNELRLKLASVLLETDKNQKKC